MKTKLVIPELRTVYFVLKQYETKQFDKAHYYDFQVCRLQEAVADPASVKINYHAQLILGYIYILKYLQSNFIGWILFF